MSESCKPDFFYDPDDWECTWDWADFHNDDDATGMAERDIGEIKRFETMIKGPDKFAARLVKTWFEGEPDEIEAAWFDSEEAAKKAVAENKAESEKQAAAYDA